MHVMPLSFLLGTFAGIASVALLAGGVYLVWAFLAGVLTQPGWLAAGICLLLWSLAGRYLVLALYPRGEDDPGPLRQAAGKKIQAPDGSILHVEFDGPQDRPVIVLTHGWSLDSTAWHSVRKALAARYRLVLWDLPGLGRSRQPTDGRYSMARLAEDLRRVIDEAGGGEVTLVGHSIGGMMILTLCRLHPDLLARRVRGIVLLDTSHLSPLKAETGGALLRVLRWPLLEPLLLLGIALWPLFWLLNAQSYMNGFSHLVNRVTSFSARVTRGQLEHAARYSLKGKPSVLSKGLRALLRWDESKTPARIAVPARVINGDADRLFNRESGMQLCELIRGADFVAISPAGHNGPLEEGAQYAEAISAFVDKTTVLPKPQASPEEE